MVTPCAVPQMGNPIHLRKKSTNSKQTQSRLRETPWPPCAPRKGICLGLTRMEETLWSLQPCHGGSATLGSSAVPQVTTETKQRGRGQGQGTSLPGLECQLLEEERGDSR